MVLFSLFLQSNRRFRMSFRACSHLMITIIALTLLAMTTAASAQDRASADNKPAPAVTHNTWKGGAPMPVAVQGAAAGLIGGKIYVVGGGSSAGYLTDTQIYDPATNTWEPEGAPIPDAIVAAASAVVGNTLYVIGGYTTSGAMNTVWFYNPKTNKWTLEDNPMPTSRGDTAAAVVNNIIYVVGGYNFTEGVLDTVEAFDPATDTWTEESPLLLPKSDSSVGSIGDAVVSAYGVASSGVTGDNEEYTVDNNSWTKLASGPEPRNEACTGSIGGLLYVAGGWNGTPLKSTESYDPSTNSWKSEAPMLKAATYPAGVVYKGKLYCFGGGSAENITKSASYNYTQIYQP
jgi:N-acetylneuraminic acid mutarotase